MVGGEVRCGRGSRREGGRVQLQKDSQSLMTEWRAKGDPKDNEEESVTKATPAALRVKCEPR